MNALTEKIMAEFKLCYEKFENEMLEKLKVREDYCFAGELFGLDVVLKEEKDNSQLTISSGEHAFWFRSQDVEVTIQIDESIDSLNQDIVENEILPQLDEYLSEKISSRPFGEIYEPEVRINFTVLDKEDETRFDFYFDVVSKANMEILQSRLKEFWLTDRYKDFVPRKAAASAERIYKFLINNLYEELGLDEVIARLDYVFDIHNKAIKDRGEGCGQQKYDRTKLAETLLQFARDYDLSNPEKIDFICYIALSVIKYGNYHADSGMELLETLKKNKCDKAAQYLNTGTGLVSQEDATWESDLAQCNSNDIFKIITFKIKDETKETYEYLLDYLLNLMNTSFPKDYKIKLNTKSKEYLPIKKMNKTLAHKFWVNCASYPELHDKIEQYINLMMDNYDYYTDVGENSDSPMPTGGYAVLTLAFDDVKYSGLFAQFMNKNEHYDHNVFPDIVVETYLQEYGITDDNIDAAKQCFEWHRDIAGKKSVKNILKETDEVLKAKLEI